MAEGGFGKLDAKDTYKQQDISTECSAWSYLVQLEYIIGAADTQCNAMHAFISWAWG